MQIFFASVKNSMLWCPPSRPIPLFLNPPNGALRSRTNQQFTHIVPARTAWEIRWARWRFSVQTTPFSPYSVSFAILSASSSVSKGIMVTIGPKISSWQIRAFEFSWTKTVGCEPPAFEKAGFFLISQSSRMDSLRNLPRTTPITNQKRFRIDGKAVSRRISVIGFLL